MPPLLTRSMANVFIVAPESLATLFERTSNIQNDAQSLEKITNLQSLHPGSVLCGKVLINTVIVWCHLTNAIGFFTNFWKTIIFSITG
ncbi:hypothetical protein MKW98_027960 [Papaver atlanticum]|uniref:Uncharacterized protein n=1 Tax=Papaver atlanticum TaxID=357466 RepID=A0AAD4SLX0_9MAGN|nr:hypothetical protein MKW98_027960 [Papaver atlanticum]